MFYQFNSSTILAVLVISLVASSLMASFLFIRIVAFPPITFLISSLNECDTNMCLCIYELPE